MIPGPVAAADRISARAPANRRRALALGAIPGAVALVVVGLVTWDLYSPVPAVAAGLVVGGLVSVLAWAGVPRLALAGIGAVPAGPDQAPRVHNLLEGLCTAVGLARPRVLVLDHGVPNALVVATDLRRSHLVVTSGLLDQLDRMELEAVLAHELSHLKSADVLPATLALVTIAPVAAAMPGMAGLVDRVIGPGREERADLGAASLTRYPPGLVSALSRIQQAGGEPPAQAWRTRLVAHLWLARPGVSLEPRLEVVGDL